MFQDFQTKEMTKCPALGWKPYKSFMITILLVNCHFWIVKIYKIKSVRNTGKD